MKRSDFLKKLGIGLGAVVVAPQVLAEMPTKEEDIPDDIKEELTEAFNEAPWKAKIISSHIGVSDEFYNEYVKYYERVPLIDILSLW